LTQVPSSVVQPVVLSVPARPGFVHLLRAVASGVAAGVDLPVDDIDDLRLAVDEALSQLLADNPASQRVVLRLTPVDDRLDVVATCDACAADWPRPDTRHSMSWHVLAALTNDAALDRAGDEAVIRFSKRVPDRTATP
jgi:serine/threonine-protein kinase RsbW